MDERCENCGDQLSDGDHKICARARLLVELSQPELEPGITQVPRSRNAARRLRRRRNHEIRKMVRKAG